MRWVVLTARLSLGAWMVFWGLNWWLRILPQPTGVKSHDLHMAFIHSGLFSVAKLTEFLMGASLLTNRFVPLMVVAGLPVTFNVAWVHFVLEGAHLSGYFVTLTHIFLAVMYLPYYRAMLSPKATPMLSLQDVRDLVRDVRHAPRLALEAAE